MSLIPSIPDSKSVKTVLVLHISEEDKVRPIAASMFRTAQNKGDYLHSTTFTFNVSDYFIFISEERLHLQAAASTDVQ